MVRASWAGGKPKLGRDRSWVALNRQPAPAPALGGMGQSRMVRGRGPQKQTERLLGAQLRVSGHDPVARRRQLTHDHYGGSVGHEVGEAPTLSDVPSAERSILSMARCRTELE